MADYSQQIQKAIDLIAKYGRTVTVQKTTITPDPTEPWKPQTETKIPTDEKAVFIQLEASQIDGTLIKSTDVSAIFGVTETLTDMTVDDTIDDQNGVVWSIIQVDKVQPAEQIILFEVILRKIS